MLSKHGSYSESTVHAQRVRIVLGRNGSFPETAYHARIWEGPCSHTQMSAIPRTERTTLTRFSPVRATRTFMTNTLEVLYRVFDNSSLVTMPLTAFARKTKASPLKTGSTLQKSLEHSDGNSTGPAEILPHSFQRSPLVLEVGKKL